MYNLCKKQLGKERPYRRVTRWRVGIKFRETWLCYLVTNLQRISARMVIKHPFQKKKKKKNRRKTCIYIYIYKNGMHTWWLWWAFQDLVWTKMPKWSLQNPQYGMITSRWDFQIVQIEPLLYELYMHDFLFFISIKEWWSNTWNFQWSFSMIW